MERYNELVAAIKVVDVAKKTVMVEAEYMVTPAQMKLVRINHYLSKQAEMAMTGEVA
jgi:hypothetical protein